VTPLSTGGLAHIWRNNGSPSYPWSAGAEFAQSQGSIAAASLIEGNFGSPGNLEVAARAGSGLSLMYRDSAPPYTWHVA
jgi:hypothetical protein